MLSATLDGFNPHTRVGCDLLTISVVVNDGVSIHTPAWGVTKKYDIPAEKESVSIHTPAWGVTGDEVVAVSENQFQSTHPRGV